MKRHRDPRAFTLIELMAAVLILALLATVVSLNLGSAVHAARTRDAVDQLRALDASARQSACGYNRSVQIVFDLGDGTIGRREVGGETSFKAALPANVRIEDVMAGNDRAGSGEFVIDCSPMGISRSYAVHLIGAGTDTWLVVAGLSGEMFEVTNEADAQNLLHTPRRDAH